ncbi:MAG: beta-carotene hydroxylase [Candidatus Saccharimonadaceae bacterium]
MVLYIILGIAAFCFMEFIAWSNHKYIMHGFLWDWHKDHHRRDNKKSRMPLNTEVKHLEKNDLFFLVYAIPAIILMIVGFTLHHPAMLAISIGITAYGFTYFIIHDVIIHERLSLNFLQRHEGSYIKSICNAHLAHHRPKTKTDFHIYGLLVFPRRYLKK